MIESQNCLSTRSNQQTSKLCTATYLREDFGCHLKSQTKTPCNEAGSQRNSLPTVRCMSPPQIEQQLLSNSLTYAIAADSILLVPFQPRDAEMMPYGVALKRIKSDLCMPDELGEERGVSA